MSSPFFTCCTPGPPLLLPGYQSSTSRNRNMHIYFVDVRRCQHSSTRRTASGPSSAHCPSPGRTGGLWTGSRAATGRRPCTSRRDVVSSRRSVCTQPCSPNKRALGVTYVLVDEQNGNVLALVGELLEGGLDGRVVGFGVHDEEVLLAVGRVGDVLCCVLVRLPLLFTHGSVRQHPPEACPLLCPASH